MFGIFAKTKKPPQNVSQQAQTAGASRFNPNWAFTYEAKRLPGPGTQNYAFENLGLVEFTPIGPSEINRLLFRSLQPAQAYAGLAIWYQGVGGLSQGTFYGQPLISTQGNAGGFVGDTSGSINA